MAAGPSHDRTDSDSNGGATTSDTVDMDVAEEDSRMASASEHAGSGMGGGVGGGAGGGTGGGAGSRALVQTDENLLELEPHEHGGENGGGVGGAGQEAEEQGDDNDNAGSADSGDAEEEAGDAVGDGDGGGRVSVGPAAALLGALGGGGGGASTGHMEPGSAGKGSPADKVRRQGLHACLHASTPGAVVFFAQC